MTIKTIFEVLKGEEKEQEIEIKPCEMIDSCGDWLEIESPFNKKPNSLILIMKDGEFLYYLRIDSTLEDNCLYRVKKGDD